jgi:predicted phage-related endonuclease
MEMGHLTEPINLALLVKNEGVAVRLGETWKHPTLPIVDTVDGIATYPDGRTAPVEAKLVLPWNAQEFGAEGTDEVPLPYYAQCQHHLWARRQQGHQETFCLMPVLVGVLEWRLYRIPWDEALAANLIKHAVNFWEKHILPKVPPPPDGTKDYAQYLAAKYPQTQSVVLPADADAERAAEIYRKAKKAADDADARMTEAANLLRNYVKEAEGVSGNGWSATWKADKNGRRTFKLKEGRAA